jgi:hypothetical protein
MYRDADPDLTPFFSDFQDAKKKSDFFLILYPQAHYLQSLIYCFKDKVVLKFYFASIISVRSMPFWEKGRIRARIPVKDSQHCFFS